MKILRKTTIRLKPLNWFINKIRVFQIIKYICSFLRYYWVCKAIATTYDRSIYRGFKTHGILRKFRFLSIYNRNRKKKHSLNFIWLKWFKMAKKKVWQKMWYLCAYTVTVERFIFTTSNLVRLAEAGVETGRLIYVFQFISVLMVLLN